jgi:hypothetical protein
MKLWSAKSDLQVHTHTNLELTKRVYRKRERNKQTRGSCRDKADHSSRSEEFEYWISASPWLHGVIWDYAWLLISLDLRNCQVLTCPELWDLWALLDLRKSVRWTVGRVRTGRRTNPDLRLNVSFDGSVLDVGRGYITNQIKSDLNQIRLARNQGRSTGWSRTKANPDFGCTPYTLRFSLTCLEYLVPLWCPNSHSIIWLVYCDTSPTPVLYLFDSHTCSFLQTTQIDKVWSTGL